MRCNALPLTFRFRPDDLDESLQPVVEIDVPRTFQVQFISDGDIRVRGENAVFIHHAAFAARALKIAMRLR